MKIRKATSRDVKRAGELLSKEFSEGLADTIKDLRSRLGFGEVHVAVEDGKVIGVISHIKSWSHFSNYLEGIVVDKKYRGLKVGMKLLDYYIGICRKDQPKKQRYALSSTDVKNKASIKFHRKFGFKELGRIKGLHYGRDEIVFGFDLRRGR
jgi:ribosomal protein S18 acetylase RimI-like enzyme